MGSELIGIVVVLVVCEMMMCGGNRHSVVWRAAAWLQDFVDRWDGSPEMSLATDDEESTPVVENAYAEEDGGAEQERVSWKL